MHLIDILVDYPGKIVLIIADGLFNMTSTELCLPQKKLLLKINLCPFGKTEKNQVNTDYSQEYEQND
jgi:hypothetical protein